MKVTNINNTSEFRTSMLKNSLVSIKNNLTIGNNINSRFQVKNKLDGGFYAIKRIKLNPESVQLNKKITREVKLLSRLNHENVVRYYNAWIESSMEQNEEEDSYIGVAKSSTKRGNSLEGKISIPDELDSQLDHSNSCIRMQYNNFRYFNYFSHLG